MKLPLHRLKNRKFLLVLLLTFGALFLVRSVIFLHSDSGASEKQTVSVKSTNGGASKGPGTKGDKQPQTHPVKEDYSSLQHYMSQLDERHAASETDDGQGLVGNSVASLGSVQAGEMAQQDVRQLSQRPEGLPGSPTGLSEQRMQSGKATEQTQLKPNNGTSHITAKEPSQIMSRNSPGSSAEQQAAIVHSTEKTGIRNSRANNSHQLATLMAKTLVQGQAVDQVAAETKVIDRFETDWLKSNSSKLEKDKFKTSSNNLSAIATNEPSGDHTAGLTNIKDSSLNSTQQNADLVPALVRGKCQDTPVVVCDEAARQKNDITKINFTDRKGGDNPKITVHDGAQHYRFTPPVRINIVNLPQWMKNEFFHISKGPLKDICIFSTKPVTNETQIVAVVGPNLKEEQKPAQRWPGQLYILMGWETPQNHHNGLHTGTSVWNNAFNSTMSYRVDADICHPYAQLFYRPPPPSQQPNYLEIAASKKKQILWIVSNCKTESQREIFAEELKKYIDVDIIGRCGRPTPCAWSGNLDCIEKVAMDYRFYLSFENSICKDYVTEKFTKVFAANKHIIPIARGGAHYDRLFPKNTFINTADFKSVVELAQFLKNMDDKTYSEYLATKDMYQLQVNTDYILDDLCRSFTERETKVSNPQLKQWLNWNQCFKAQDFAWSTQLLYYAKHLTG